MSLLIKALQKAEQSKGEAAEASTQQPTSPVAPAALELSLHHDEPAPSLREEGGFESPRVPPVATPAQREAASSVLRAGAQPAARGSSHTMWLAVAGLVLLLLLGGGFYVYLNSLEQPQLVAVSPPPAPPVATPAPATVEPTQSEAVAAEQAAAPMEQEAPPVAVAQAPVVKDEAADEAPVARPAEPAVKMTEKPAIKPSEASAAKVTRNRPPKAVVSDDVMAGYQAFMAGDDAAAARYYRQAVQADPRNQDALLGAAAVAARQGRTDEATAQYMRVLELEPKNLAAQTGLVALVGQSDPAASESRLKSLLAQHPETAFLHAALANHYADQGQWAAAQQSYFQAYRYDARNPEYAFNLAVSLDQMGKSELALNHYQRALELLPAQGGALDRAQLEARVAQLRQSLNQ